MLRTKWLLPVGLSIAAGGMVVTWWLQREGESEASCATDAGPTAIIGVSTDGDVQWRRLLGHAVDVSTTDGVLAVDGTEIRASLDVASGETVSCTDLDANTVDVPVQASTLPRSDDPTRPVFVEQVSTEDWRVLRAVPAEWTGGQTMHLAIERASGERLWDAPVPGFVVQIAGDLLLAIDQTDGTGNFNEGAYFPTLLTAYDIESGDQQWSVSVPGTPHDVIGADDVIAIPGGGDLHGVDPSSGVILWRTELGNPGRSRHYSERGDVRQLAYDAATNTIVAVVPARPEYRD